MTDMKRITISFTDELVEKIEALRKQSDFESMSYSEIVRVLVARGLEKKRH